ncbi:MAG: hypothetical protein ND895_01750 [Pyrinomonadaceae bacterium]|nr:hypothetical protein [Pyrinomonadaceae bacterium]
MMNRKTNRLVTLITVVLTACLFTLAHSASAQEQSTATLSAHSNCRSVQGNLREVGNSTGTTGRITNGGILNGRTQLLYTSGVLPTPDPTSVSYTTDFTVTTNRGILKTHNAGIFEFAAGVFTEIARIDPNASTGRFAGATGVLFTSGKTPDGGATFRSKISGEVCLAHHGYHAEDEDDDDNE